MKAALIINPVAGRRAKDSIAEIEQMIVQRVTLKTCTTEKRGDAFKFSRELKGVDRIIIAGGDGTINEVINGIMSSGKDELFSLPIAILPTGTTNVLARELSIPYQIDKAVDLALKGNPGKVSLGKIDGKYFSLMAGIGFDGDVVLDVENTRMKRYLGKAAYIFSGIKRFIKYRPAKISIRTCSTVDSGYLVIASNSRFYGGDFEIAPSASLSEPMLDVTVYGGRGRIALLGFIFGVITNNHHRLKDLRSFKSDRVELSSDREVNIQIDGDYHGKLPVTLEIVKDALSFVRPEELKI